MSSTDQPDARALVPPAVPVAGAPPVAEEGPPSVGGQPRETVSLAGQELSVCRQPGRRADLPPAVYVHGLGGSARNWSALMALLTDSVDGVALDLPGFGESPPPANGDYSVSGHARAVIRYVDGTGDAPVHLLGNSLGGAVATRVAALRPELVRTLTLVSPALPELPPQRTALPTGLLAVPGATALFGRLTRHWTAQRRTSEVLALCYGDPSRVTEEGYAAAVAEYEHRLTQPHFWDALARSARGLVGAYTMGGQQSLWRQAERVLAPTLLIYGGRDLLVSPRRAGRASAAFRDSRLLTLPDAGHVAMMEYPQAVAGAFRELLAETDRTFETLRGA
ncbi:alpha/beta fold hydrolase [Streptomyces oceani]|uniref:Hydrolase n=1 Tax=Streptomyces oceani TaxID=1075402 RepID=A0A1E7KPW4_9ACTN|nr:alpha/beta hydrolase [Streptomyces oceani]OEV05934.1 hydrolase [Streptomyces oceani]